MISFFRKFLSSWIVLALFAIILISFAVTGFGSGGAGGLEQLALGGDTAAKVGSVRISNTTLERHIKARFELAQRQNPTLTFSEFLKTGAFDGVLNQLIDIEAIGIFAKKNDLVISGRLLDSELAKDTGFNDPTGKFDPNVYANEVAKRGFDTKSYEAYTRNVLVYRQLDLPASFQAAAAVSLTIPYAGLALEKRFGATATVSTSRFAGGAAPTEAELTAFYSRSIARYTVPETRVIRYAVFDRSKVEAQSVPTEAEIAAAYAARSAQFAPRETRVFTQAIIQDEAKAKAMAAQIASGTAIAKAATTAGSEAITLDPQEQKGFAALSSDAIAKAAFAAAKGAVVGPLKSPLGWHVARVDAINSIGGKSLAQVRGELVAAQATNKREQVYADLLTKMDDAIGDGVGFDDLVKTFGLTIVKTPPVTEQGKTLDGSAPLDSALLPMLTDAFTAEPDDEPVMVPIASGQRETVYDLEAVSEAAPKPLGNIRNQVAADFLADRATTAARKAAADVVANVEKGTPLAKALSDAGLGAAQPLSAQRDTVKKDGPATLTTLFDLSRGKAKVVESADRQSFTIVALERIERTDVSKDVPRINAVRAQLSQAAGQEFAVQLIAAIRAEAGVTRNKEVIERLRTSLTKPGNQ